MPCAVCLRFQLLFKNQVCSLCCYQLCPTTNYAQKNIKLGCQLKLYHCTHLWFISHLISEFVLSRGILIINLIFWFANGLWKGDCNEVRHWALVRCLLYFCSMRLCLHDRFGQWHYWDTFWCILKSSSQKVNNSKVNMPESIMLESLLVSLNEAGVPIWGNFCFGPIVASPSHTCAGYERAWVGGKHRPGRFSWPPSTATLISVYSCLWPVSQINMNNPRESMEWIYSSENDIDNNQGE